jgi:hypothetical protein
MMKIPSALGALAVHVFIISSYLMYGGTMTATVKANVEAAIRGISVDS